MTQRDFPRPRGEITFNRDIAPILFEHCAACHRTGQSAPFSLLDYGSARKHAREIAETTARRYMPPWLPEPGYGEFVDERRLDSAQISILQRWAAEGAVEGSPADLPPLPKFTEGWQLGEPDLVIRMPEPYLLGPDGKDLYRNFVVPAPIDQPRFVQGFEFHPNSKAVHHVRILLDPTRQARRLDGQNGAPGFGGMRVPAQPPTGHLLTWVPGKTAAREPEGLAWVLEPGTDIVVQIHMQRTGKEEAIQPTIGLYFTNRPPSKPSFQIGLNSELIDIPAGEKNYAVERSFELPADVEVVAVLPHLHYLGKEIQGYAILPDGTKQWLLFIRHWDFNWQGDYRYKKPIFLPQGSVIFMHYTYDNSAENERNPNHPPRRIAYGPQSTDEMGELWLQVLPRGPEGLPALEYAHRMFGAKETAAYYENQLRVSPETAVTHLALGKALGPIGRVEEALQHFQRALELQPELVEAHYYMGLTLTTLHRWPEAKSAFASALRLKPDYFKAHDGLGVLFLQMDQPQDARAEFKEALRLNPQDPVARQHLEEQP